MDLSRKSCLVLNSAFEPLSFCSAKRAVTLIYKGIAKTEKTRPEKIYTTTMWDEITGDFILVDQFLPSVIRLLEYKFIPVRLHILTRRNILNRDHNTCQYCGKVFSPKALTLDHVRPRSKGGQSTWENLVACCHSCNNKKGNKLLTELTDMKLIRMPRSIGIHTSRHLLRNLGMDDPDWRKFLFYDSDEGENQWTEELEGNVPIE
jgi:hypothetical protein